MKSKSFRLSGSDWFALFQIAMAYAFAIPQIHRMSESVRGMTINWLLCAFLFIVLNLCLTVGSYVHTHDRQTLQALAIYANWFLLLIPMVTITFVKCAWTGKDTLIFSLVAASATGLAIWAKAAGRSLRDAVIRGLMVGLFRVVPHAYMCYVFVSAGRSDGIASMTVFSANVTALARIATLYHTGSRSALSAPSGRWDPGVRASFLSECANEGSWLITSAFWFAYL